MNGIDAPAFLFSSSLVGISVLCLMAISRPGLVKDRTALYWWMAGDLFFILHRVIILLQPGVIIPKTADFPFPALRDAIAIDAAVLMLALAFGVIATCRLTHRALSPLTTGLLIGGPPLVTFVLLETVASPGLSPLVIMTGSGLLTLLQIAAAWRGLATSVGLRILTVTNMAILCMLCFGLFELSQMAPEAISTSIAERTGFFMPPFAGLVADFIGSIARTFAFLIVMQERQNRYITRLSITDPLTEVLNRRGGQLELSRGVSFAAQHKTPYSLAIIDIDHFKRVNDQFGHEAGDEVLKAFAAAIAESTGDNTILSRWGGEEFLLALPGRNKAGAVRLLERLRAHLPMLMAGKAPCVVTFSAGIAELGEAGDKRRQPLSIALDLADRRLYRAKVTRDAIVASIEDADQTLAPAIATA